MIKPTVGRVVLFQPQKALEQPPLDQPYAATIAYVWGDRMVNLSWVDHNGRPGASTSVTLLQDDDVGNQTGHFAYWMPYQVEQEAKAALAREHGIEPGDTVRLRSGGLDMVVDTVTGDRIYCKWMAGNGIDVCEHAFKAPMLETVKSGEAPEVEIDPPSVSAMKLAADEIKLCAPSVTVTSDIKASGPGPSLSVFRKLRIVSDSRLTRVYDFDSGAEVKLVQSLRLEHHKGGRMYARVETLERAESFEIVADGEVRCVEPRLTPAAGPVWSASESRAAADPVAERGASEGLAVL